MAKCNIEGCERISSPGTGHGARGLCAAHYQQAKNGDIPMPPRQRRVATRGERGRLGRAAWEKAIAEGRCACSECMAGRAAAVERMKARGRQPETQAEFGARMTRVAGLRRAEMVTEVPEGGWRGGR